MAKAAADSSSDEVIPPKRKQPKAGKRKKSLGPILAERAKKKSKVKRSPSASSSGNSSSSYLPRSSSSSSEVTSSKRVRAKPSAKLSRSLNQSKSFIAKGETLADFDPCKISAEGFAEINVGMYLSLMDWFKPGGAGSENLSGKKLQRAKQVRLRETDPAAFRVFLDRYVLAMLLWYAKDSYTEPSHEKHWKHEGGVWTNYLQILMHYQHLHHGVPISKRKDVGCRLVKDKLTWIIKPKNRARHSPKPTAKDLIDQILFDSTSYMIQACEEQKSGGIMKYRNKFQNGMNRRLQQVCPHLTNLPLPNKCVLQVARCWMNHVEPSEKQSKKRKDRRKKKSEKLKKFEELENESIS